MTTPRVIELPRRLEPTSLDTFLGGDARPLAVVVPLRPRDAGRPRSRARAPRPMNDPGPGDQAA